MDAYLSSFCKTLKADILQSKHKEAIRKAEKIVEREANNFKQLSRNTFIYFLYLESYCCHKTILKSLMEQNSRIGIDKSSLEIATRIMFRNLKAIYITIQHYLQNRHILINFQSGQSQTCVSLTQQNTSDVSQKSFTNFIEISTWLIKDQILLLNLGTYEDSKSDIFQTATKFLHLATTTIKRKKIRFRVNYLEIKCQFVVFLFRIKEYSKCSKLTQKTLTQIYEFLFYLTHKKDKSGQRRTQRYKKAIKKCYKLLLVVLIYQAFLHVVSDSIHSVQALLSVIKRVQGISGPKEMIKYYQGYKQVFNQLLVATIAHEEFAELFKGTSIFSIPQIYTLCEVKEKIKTATQNHMLYQPHLDFTEKLESFIPSRHGKKKKTILSERAETNCQQSGKGAQIESKSKISHKADQIYYSKDLSKQNEIFKNQEQFCINLAGFRSGTNFGNNNKTSVFKKSGGLSRRADRTLGLSEQSLEYKIINGKKELVRKKVNAITAFAAHRCRLDDKQGEQLGPDMKKKRQSGDFGLTGIKIKDQKEPITKNYFTTSFQTHRKNTGSNKNEHERRQQLTQRQNNQQSSLSSFIRLLVKNKSTLSIWALANKLEIHLKKQQNKKVKDKSQTKLLQDNFIRDIFWQKNQGIKFRNTSLGWKEREKASQNCGKLKLKKIKSQNLQAIQMKKTGQFQCRQKQVKLKNQSNDQKPSPPNISIRNSNRKRIQDEVGEEYEQKLRLCLQKSRESIDDVTNKVLRKSQNYRRTKDRNIKKSQAFFCFEKTANC